MSAAVPAQGRNMGQPIARYEARAKVTGSAQYASDVPVTTPAYAYLVLSTIGKGSIRSIDERAARAIPGVLDVMTHANRPPIKPIAFFFAGGPGYTSAIPLDGTKIDHAGQIVAMVVADSYEAAREAGHRLDIDYARAEPATTFGSPGVEEKRTGEVNPQHKDPKLGDAEAALAASAVVHDGEYATPVQHHNTIELFTTTAHWEGETLVVNEPSQFVHGLRQGLATQLAMPAEKIRVVNDYVGGAFGSKAGVTQRTSLVALASRRLGRPVKLVPTREQCFSIAGHRQETKHRVRLGASADGRLTAYHHDIWELTARTDPYVNTGIENSVCMYNFPTVMSTAHMVRADRNVPVFMRSPPEVPVMFALESAMDELAIKLKMDPVDLRKLNDTRKNNVTGAPFTSRSLNECYDAAAASFGWSRRSAEPGSMRDGDWLIGWGCATATYPTNLSPAVVRVTLADDGQAKAELAAHDVGTGTYTVIGQMTAECLGLRPEQVTVSMGDSRLPPGPISGGSVTTASACSAVKLACDQILARLQLPATATQRQRTAAFERLKLGAIEETGNYVPSTSRSKSTAGMYKGQVDISGGVHGPSTMFSFGAEFVEVRINARTREVRVPRMVGAFAAGRIMNPRTAHSQLMGGMIWGVSSALHEATELDTREARYINNNLAEYLVPVNADIGQVDIILMPEVDTAINPAGVKGLGELANVGTAAAVANAVHHATGIRIRELPVRIEKLLQA